MKTAMLVGNTNVELLNLTSMELLERAAHIAPDRIGLKQPRHLDDDERVWTYAEFLADARKLASFLATRFGYGDRLAIWAPNRVHWFLYQFAAAHLGVVLVTLNPALRQAELEYMLGKSQAKGIILDRSFRGSDMIAALGAVRPSLPELQHILMFDEWSDHLASGSGDPPPSPTQPLDPALIVFTSGTTGKAKGAILHHYSAVNNANLCAIRSGIKPGSVWLTTLPAFHVGGPVTNCLGAISQQHTQVIMPPFEAGMILEVIERERVNFMPLVPAMLIPMVEHPTFPQRDVSSLEAFMVGGTTITPSFIAMAREKLDADIQVIYGQTELCAEVTKTERGDPDDVLLHTVGTPLPHTKLKIANIATRETCQIGQVGEICVESPFATIGYFGDPDATSSLFDETGYLRTGDLGLITEDGKVRITGRLKEVIIRGGENVYPREIEDALAEYPGIAESAVIGLPHERWGEEVAAILRPSEGVTVDIEAVRSFIELRVARFKVPKHWKIVNDFPRNPSGKIQKFALKELFVTEESTTGA
jgi:fatty-acyl-CoA synthase